MISGLTTGKLSRFNPLRYLQLDSLSRHLDAFQAGYLREAAGIWDALEQRDDLLRGVIAKRKKSVARYGWTVLPKPNLSPDEQEEARVQQEALEYFYNNLESENALDEMERGGFKLLARQMMDAVGKRFAIHEILWKTGQRAGGTNRRFVTAKFRFVPLGFFENTTGRLRFLPSESAVTGQPLEPGAWMVTVGEGLMIASSIAWMLKNISLNDWLKCSERNGTPGLRGVSAAVRGSADWQALEQALADLQAGKAVVHGTTDEVHVVDYLAGGNIPFPKLVERMDRMMATLWRGADLSTLSRDRGYGASLQEKETCALEEDDAEMLTETLNRYVDEWVVRHVFGENAPLLARVKVLVSPRECTTGDLQIDEFLLRHGAPLSIQETMNRYGRALPKEGEKVFLQNNISRPEMRSIAATKVFTTEAKASLPESLQNLGTVEGITHSGNGPSVSFRGCSPLLFSGSQPIAVWPPDEGAVLANDGVPGAESDWIQLSPYGAFSHRMGLQQFDRGTAERMVERFSSWSARLGRLFGGLPVYVGHPDMAEASDTADRRAYGWIHNLAAREDGLYGRVNWSEAGQELLRNGHFKFLSPYWEAREKANTGGQRIYEPVALLSVGLTNQPNLPVKPLANESPGRGSLESPGDNNSSEGAPAGEKAAGETAAGGTTLRESPELPEPAAAPCTPMHTVSLTNELGSRRAELDRTQHRRERIQEAVLGKVRLGLTYDEAWASVKKEHPLWFGE